MPRRDYCGGPSPAEWAEKARKKFAKRNSAMVATSQDVTTRLESGLSCMPSMDERKSKISFSTNVFGKPSIYVRSSRENSTEFNVDVDA